MRGGKRPIFCDSIWMICFSQSRTKLALVAVIFAAWTLVVGLFAVISAYLDGLWPYLGLSLFAPLALAGAVVAIMTARSWMAPATLKADLSGFSLITWRGEQRLGWDAVESFIVFSPTSRLRSPGCVLKAGAKRYISFGRNWNVSAEEIVEALEEARTRV